MNLQIRDPRAHALAKRLAHRRGISMTEAVVEALEAELRRQVERTPLADRLALIADDLADMARAGGRDMTRTEVDDMWGTP